MDNVKQQLVERWHFSMLNDSQRNANFKAAIKKSIQEGSRKKVLDIGTGTGLLALYAYQCGAQDVSACDQSALMCSIARKVFERNSCGDRIRLLNKHSTVLKADEDLNGHVDLVFTETMDCGIFGEGLLQTLIHAKENLLASNGQIIPGRVRLFVAGFQSRHLAMENNVVNSSSFTDTIFVRNLGLSSNSDEPYDSCHVKQLKDFKLITKCEEALRINLNNLDELYALANGSMKKSIRLAYTVPNSILDGFCVWFQLGLDDEETIRLSTDPFNQTDNEKCCWESAIFRLNHRFTNTQKLQYLNVTMSCANGVLHLNHYYDLYGKTFSDIDPDIVKYLNDTEFINRIEFDVFAELKKRSGISNGGKSNSKKTPYSASQAFADVVLDFLPFPTVGMALLKEKRAKKLFCSRNVQEFVTFTAVSNCIPLTSIVFLDDPADILFVPEKFDLIILPLVDKLGAVISAQIANYSLLKANKLKPNGTMVPERLEVWVDLINSPWLKHVTRVTDPELEIDSLQIGPLINEYATALQLDLTNDFDYKCCYGAYRTADIQLNDTFQEIEHKLYLGDTVTVIHGILYYFHYYFTKSSNGPISTKRQSSFVRLGCFVCNDEDVVKIDGFITLLYRQNSGVVKLELK